MRLRFSRISWMQGLAVTAIVLAQASIAAALPTPGEKAVRARVTDPDGRVLDLRFPHEKPILILYEGKTSEKQNQVLKDELERLSRQEKESRKAIRFAAVADVAKYDYWPVRGLAERTIRQRAAETGSAIYCDWDGRFRSAFGIDATRSTVLFIGADGRVQFAAEGPLRADARERLIEMLREAAGSTKLANNKG
ncbi:MAG: hypothetical protein IPM54_01510 [Polyangiaceae bacterium]|nr:hypothetical protein [Polyangiaceae bacterium]